MSDDILKYLTKGQVKTDLEAVLGEYDSFTGIDSFFNHSTNPKTFYEWSIQGMIYDLLARRVVQGKYDKYMLFLEQPYSPNNVETRSDIMWVEVATDYIGAMELKTDYSYTSVLNDLRKLENQIAIQSVKYGVMVFMVDDAATIQTWINQAEHEDAKVKNAIKAKTLFPIGVVYKRN
ncbi:hypothetical protein GCM10017044_15660 [Kordiimonas sediminis]|uniref:Uncharacterized protein n=1 Tax=Kordiimonas sediminis TaxID=1735581 RepID=A0A919E5V9_9PROT|nr:hypothetical protein [Kordiimonas sediminis]GHF22366.1 hypothetical protein GCM10017044_15660 [Kordiimonas sediminis]